MNERDLFLSALEIDDPAARQAHLQSVCADDASLLARVESLLASHESQSLFLQTPAVEQLGNGVAEDVAATTCVPPDSADRANSREERQQPDNPDDETLLGFLQPSGRPDSLGRLAHYEILEVIGRGAFGTVLRAFDDKLQRIVAIKVMAPELATTSPARKRFLREAQASAQIRHENVVSVYDVYDKPIPFLVMEYIPGQTLQQRLDEQGPLELLDVLRLGIQIAKGLAAAHARDLIHRDIKPGNILLETTIQDRVKITDFGLARAADDASMTQSGMIAGTPLYMAPEQALGQKLDQRADLFSLGSVLYQMVSGRAPFRAPSALAVLKRVTEDTPRPIQEIIPETPDWLCDIIAKLHAKNPDARFQSAREVAAALEQHLAHLHQPDKVLAPRKMPQRAIHSQRNPWWPGVVLWGIHAVAISLAVVAMLVVFPRFMQTFIEFDLQLPWTTVFVVNFFHFVERGGWLLLPLLLAVDAALLIGLRTIPKVGPKFSYLWFATVLAGMLSLGALSVIGLFQPLVALQRELGQGESLANLPADPALLPAHGQSIAGWGVGIDPAGDCRIKLEADVLTLAIPGGNHNLNPTPAFNDLTAPRVLQPAMGDFELQTRVEPQTGVGNIPKTYQGAGLLLWQDEQNFLRFLRAANGDTQKVFVHLEYFHDGQMLVSEGIDTEKRPLDLRIVRSGDDYRLSYRIAGSGWRGFQPSSPVRLTGKLQVGVAGINSTAEPLTANFAGLSLRLGAASSPVEWVQLFNGQDLTGWKFHPDHPGEWEVKDGVLRGSKRQSHLFSERGDYRNFHLRAEAKSNLGGDSGILFRAPLELRRGRTPAEFGIPGCYEAELHHNRALTRRTGSIMEASGDAPPSVLGQVLDSTLTQPDEWFTYEVIAQGNHFITKINGEEVARCNDPLNRHEAGHLALQVWHANTLVQFRKIEIKELPPETSATPPLAIAPFDVAQAKAHQKSWADHLGVPVEMTNSIGMKLRLIPPGEFLMGETQEASDRLVQSLEQAGADEFSKFAARFSSPQHKVRITQPSYLGACEVTVSQYRRFIDETKYIGTLSQLGVKRFDWTASATEPNPEERAVLGVSWDDAKAFCKWLSKQEGVAYDLPSEAQWEYACRAGTVTAWSFGDDAAGLDEHAVFGRANLWPTEVVGSKTPNPFGLFDMHGNADEWCLDWHQRNFYAESPIEDPVHTNEPKDRNSGRVARGGTAVSAPWWTRSSTRAFDFPATPNTPKGFRVTLVGSANLKKIQVRNSAQKTAESDARGQQPPADSKLIKLRAFTPGKDKLPIALRTGGQEVVTVDGDAWRIENSGQGGNFNVMIAQLLDDIPEDGVFVFRAKVRVAATEKTTWGSLMFGGANELFSNWDQWPEALSRFDFTEAQWVEKEARMPVAQFRKTDPPAIYLYTGLHNTGVLWIKEVELLHLPAPPASIGQTPPPAVGPVDAAQAKEHQNAAAPKSTANTQPIKLRAFTPGKDKLPIALRTDGKEVVTVDGDAWRIENSGQGGNFNVIIAQILEDIPLDGVLLFRAKVKVEATEKTTWGHLGFGGANHQFISWNQWPEVLTRFNITDTQWVEKEVRHPAAECHEADPPAVYLYTGLHNTGVMWIKDVELLHLPAAAKRNE